MLCKAPKLTYLTTGGSSLLRYFLRFCKSYCNCIYIFFSLGTKEPTLSCLQWFRLLPCQVFNSPLDKVKQHPYCKLAALPPSPMSIHKLLQLGSVVSPTLQHPQHLFAFLITPLSQHSLQKGGPGAWSKLLPKSFPFLPLFLLLTGRL